MPLHFPHNYGFVPVAATSVRESWQGGDGGEAKGRNFQRQRSSLPSVPSCTAVAFPLQLHSID
jgi:hypothetical protein